MPSVGHWHVPVFDLDTHPTNPNNTRLCVMDWLRNEQGDEFAAGKKVEPPPKEALRMTSRV